MFEEDDDYYDDEVEDDEYYDDDDYDEGGGGRGVLLAVVAVLVLVALGGVFAGIFILMDLGGGGRDRGGHSWRRARRREGPSDRRQGRSRGRRRRQTQGLLRTGRGSRGGSIPLDSITPDGDAGRGAPPIERGSRSGDRATDSVAVRSTRGEETRREETPRYREPPSERRNVSSRSDSTPRESTSSRSTRSDDSRDSGDGGTVAINYSNGSSSSRSDSSRRDSRSDERGTESASEDTTPREGQIMGEETPVESSSGRDAAAGGSDSGDSGSAAEEPPPASDLTYERDSIASLSGKAGGGSLSTSELGHLQGIPPDHRNFTLAWATVMKNAESKRDYKGHCEAAGKIVELPRTSTTQSGTWRWGSARCGMGSGALRSSRWTGPWRTRCR